MFSTGFLVMIIRESQIICVLALKVFSIWLKSYASLSFDNCFPLHSSCYEFCIRKSSLLSSFSGGGVNICTGSGCVLLPFSLAQKPAPKHSEWSVALTSNSSCLRFLPAKMLPEFQVLLQINLSFIFSFFLPLSLFISFLFFLSIF